MKKYLKQLGALRSMLVGSAIFIILCMPLADVTMSPEGWGWLRSAALPAAAPIIFMVLMLDLMMCQILKSDADAERRAQLSFASKVYLVISVILIAVWMPVFLRATYF